MRKLIVLLLATASLMPAAILNYSDTTVGEPVWNRPVAGNPPISPLSGVGTAVPYHVLGFQVSLTGAYDFVSLATVPSNWDNYLFLYSGSFDSGNPLANVLIGNDDFPSIGVSGFSGINLTSGTQYYLVTTGFGNADAGVFENSIRGDGDIYASNGSAIPEPGTWGLALLGLAAAGLVSRRRQRS